MTENYKITLRENKTKTTKKETIFYTNKGKHLERQYFNNVMVLCFVNGTKNKETKKTDVYKQVEESHDIAHDNVSNCYGEDHRLLTE